MTPDNQVLYFWTPISQIVPVFALALVIEARRSARRWRNITPGVRKLQALGYAATGYLLVTVEIWAIDSLWSGLSDDTQVQWTRILLAIAIALLVSNPVIALGIVAFTDVAVVAQRIFPRSAWRQLRSREKVLGYELAALANLVLDTIDLNNSLLHLHRKRLRVLHDRLPGLVSSKKPGSQARALEVREEIEHLTSSNRKTRETSRDLWVRAHVLVSEIDSYEKTQEQRGIFRFSEDERLELEQFTAKRVDQLLGESGGTSA